MERNHVATIVSTAGLASAIAVWFEIFAFAKTVHMPAWAFLLPSPFLASCIIALLCLTPAALITTSTGAAVRGLVWAVLLSPILALVIYAADPVHQHSGLPLNLAFQYGWIVVTGLLLPSASLLGIRVVLGVVAPRLTSAWRRRTKTHAPQA